MHLILHSTSTGPLRERLDEFWKSTESQVRATKAQQWLPHATLAKTLRLPSGVKANLSPYEIDMATSLLLDIVNATPQAERTTPQLTHLIVNANWCGIEFKCPRWIQIGQEFQSAAREKIGLNCEVESNQHISVAYGRGYDQESHGSLARQLLAGLDLNADTWNLGLWSRISEVWTSQILISW